jgi:hypothetical protein
MRLLSLLAMIRELPSHLTNVEKLVFLTPILYDAPAKRHILKFVAQIKQNKTLILLKNA